MHITLYISFLINKNFVMSSFWFNKRKINTRTALMKWELFSCLSVKHLLNPRIGINRCLVSDDTKIWRLLISNIINRHFSEAEYLVYLYRTAAQSRKLSSQNSLSHLMAERSAFYICHLEQSVQLNKWIV